MPKVIYENPQGAAPAQGLYSHAARVEGSSTVYVAGQLAVNSDGSVAAKGDFRGQFQKVFANLGDVLSGLGGGFDSVAKFTTYLVHSQDIELFMGERQKLFKDIYPDGICPPNTLLVVDRLVKEDFLIEIEAIAIIDRP